MRNHPGIGCEGQRVVAWHQPCWRRRCCWQHCHRLLDGCPAAVAVAAVWRRGLAVALPCRRTASSTSVLKQWSFIIAAQTPVICNSWSICRQQAYSYGPDGTHIHLARLMVTASNCLLLLTLGQQPLHFGLQTLLGRGWGSCCCPVGLVLAVGAVVLALLMMVQHVCLAHALQVLVHST